MMSYQLSSKASLLEKGEYSFTGLLGNMDGTVQIDENGGFDIRVATPLKPFETVIIELRKKQI